MSNPEYIPSSPKVADLLKRLHQRIKNNEPLMPSTFPPEVIVSAPSITCPKCGKTSYHPRDIAENYCGNCHEFH